MRVLVVVPTYNERENIEVFLDRVLAQKVEGMLHVLVVDDGSPDGTGDYVAARAARDSRIHLLRRSGKMGLGSAYVAGFRWALERGYDRVVQMDADLSHNPEDIPRLLDALKDADWVIGSRYSNGISVVNWPMKRLLLSYFANVYARVVTGVPIRDLTGGFKAWKTEVLRAVDLARVSSDGYAFQIEMNVKAYTLGYHPREIPIIFIERRAGESKMSRRIIWEAFWLVWALRIWRLRHPRPTRSGSDGPA
jgi:dolichol-phosphate mannosyltransferase